MNKYQSDSTEPNRWKTKYLTAMEAIDKKERDFESQLDVLRRGLVRVSLAADGVDGQLDEQLSLLRDSLRGALEIEKVESLITNIENAVRKLDENKQQSFDDLATGYEKLVNSLMIEKLPRKTKSKLKDFDQNVKKCVGKLDAQVNLINEYGDILEDVLALLINAGSAEKPASFWQRLLPRGDKNAVNELASSEASTNAGDSLDLDEGADSDNSHYQEQIARERVIGIILALLDQLNLPEALMVRAARIRANLKKGIEWGELPETLSETISLLTGSTIASQRDFEAFLMALNNRLMEIQQFIVSNKTDESEDLDSAEALNQSVKNQVASLQNSLGSIHDVADLKVLVQNQLDTIVQSFDVYRQAKVKKRDSVFEKIDALGQRLEAMETESNQLKETIAEQREQALRDALTQLPNRQAYMEHADKELARRERYGSQLTLVVSDVDHFKRINDSYGHLSGDKVLKVIAKEITKRLRASDFIARYGGEEFVILMPETDQDAGFKAINSVREAVANCPFHFRKERVPITVSFGVTQVRDGDTIEMAFARADKALYEAKEQGRNKVVIGS